ncbi:alpha-glucan family phosphorylase [Methanoculleus sp. 7T]|uniref:alpha-glucan family phosphorylase n=1 Tax=Methanoculleus sp. 7T TaxID=2937282 RepID=UPI0020BEE9F0|nr:alpha-glucan family phosphorylase [Methanoculleus sp. 7T]MCK8519731.1 alpha-glucan family phosphorylase [Methanoculleus sp. 7T]
MAARDPVCGMPVDPAKAAYSVEARGGTYYFSSELCRDTFVEGEKIAYFSMEIGLESDIPTYSGGLGVLAGDVIRSSADLLIPMVAVTLVNRKGYVQQRLTPEGDQIDLPDEWKPKEHMRELPRRVTVQIGDASVAVRAWLYDYWSPVGGLVPVLFLDTDLPENAPGDREITDYLYGGDQEYRLKQAVVLGIGGARMLDALGIKVGKYHINESHSSLLTLELLKRPGMDEEKVQTHCIFTTHTPVAVAFETFPQDMAVRLLRGEIPQTLLDDYIGEGGLALATLAFRLSRYVNGVTTAHMNFSRRLFPGFHIRAVTNGVHPHTWTSGPFRDLYDRYISGWAQEPELLVRVDEIPHEDIRHAHQQAKQALVDYVAEKNGVDLDLRALTIGFARRAAAYKRATLIFSNLEKLREAGRQGAIQLVFAGKAHPADAVGKQEIREVHDAMRDLDGEVTAVYLENYTMDLAGLMTAGVDVWLNTPLPPYEASGTSGMKAALNGVVNFSVLDGWWIEGWIEGTTGWAIGPEPSAPVNEAERRSRELQDLYSKLEYLIIPTYYLRKDEWATIMRSSIAKIAYYFNTHRMMRRYATEAYL